MKNCKVFFSQLVIIFLFFSHPCVLFAKIDKQLIPIIENYINGITTMKANFMQIDDKGFKQSGVFYLSKPHKLRWEYQKPKSIDLVSNSDLSMIYDHELEETYFCKENCGPKYFLANQEINLTKDLKILSLEKSEKEIRLIFTDRKDPSHRKLITSFTLNPVKIKSVAIKEEGGLDISIEFYDIKYKVKLNESLFSCIDPNFFKQKF